MLPGLEKVKSHRVWFVPGFAVWGLAGWSEIEFVTLEQVGSDVSALFGAVDVGDNAQQVAFSDLTDHRGSQLPSTISMPRILIRPKTNETAFIVGDESNESFKIARDPDSAGPVTVDLLVVEMGV